MRRPDEVSSELVEERYDAGTEIAGRYRIVRLLVESAIADVYAARDTTRDTDVALEVLRPDIADSSTTIARIRRELASAKRVSDPHVCRVFDAGEHAGRIFRVSELLDGKPLAGPLPIDALEVIAPQLVGGLAALHDANILHRELTTANAIVVGERVVLTGYGLAPASPAYMAPEQLEGRPATFSSDIYALGVVLFELATGSLPFDEPTAKLTHDAPKPSSLRASVPVKWDTIITSCLRREPALRPEIGEILAYRPLRRTILAGALVVTGAALTGWRMLRRQLAPYTELPPDALVALLPCEGDGPLLSDPVRLALTVDIHDRFATTGTALLALDSSGTRERIAGTASQLVTQTDPLAAALAIDGVTAVVRLTLVGRDPLWLEIAVKRRPDAEITTTWLSRPPAEATLLVDDIVQEIAKEIAAPLPRRAGDATTYAPDVYARYGEALVQLFAPDGNGAALEALANAQPKLARAAARAADRIVADGAQKTGDVVWHDMDRALALCDRALAADPELGLAHAVRGAALAMKWDWRGADRETARGLELQPWQGRVRFHRHMLTTLRGRFDDSLAMATDWLRANPLDPMAQVDIVTTYHHARRWAAVVDQPVLLEPALPADARIAVLARAAVAHAHLARLDAAVANADRVLAMPEHIHHPYEVALLVAAYVLAGQRDKAAMLRTQLYDRAPPFVQALMDDALGDHERALARLEVTVESHHVHALFLAIERFSNTLREHPRFHALVTRVSTGGT